MSFGTLLRSVAVVAAFAFLSAAAVTLADDAQTPVAVAMKVDCNKVARTIDPKIYSHFLEHIYNSCNGGLWGELVWNRSLEAGNEVGWSFDDGILKQNSRATDRRLLLGADKQKESPWTDYDVRVLAKKISGAEGFLVMFRAAPDMSSYYWLNLGGWNNTSVAIEKETPSSNGRHILGGSKPIPPIEEGQIYDIRIVVTGRNIKVFVNQELLHEVVDFADDAPTSGCVGVGTWSTQAEFGSVLVRDLRRQTLYDLHDDNLTVKSPVNVRYWTVEGAAESRRGDARNSAKYLRFNGEGALGQKNFAFEAQETYDYSFWARGEGSVSFNTVLNNSENVKNETFNIKSDEWVKKTGVFVASKSSSDSSIRLDFQPNAECSIDVDQISVFPRSWKEKTGGLRPDLLQAIADIHPTMIRWPGGCYASAYRWKSGVGSQDDRVSYPIELWNDVDTNSFGIDEFVPFCHKVGAEPIMVVNIGTEQWIKNVGDPKLRDVDWLQEVCDWVEYCNGDASTKWGAIRSQNGHPEPYAVKYWEIDNEVESKSTPSTKYVAILNELIPRMKAIDPSIKIIACGSWTGDKMKWDAEIVKGAARNIDYLSLHRYDDPNSYAYNPYDNQRFFEAHREMIAQSDNPNLKLFSSEWNAQSTDWRTGLYAGGYLNCCERVADVLEIAAPALFLRHKTATGWDNAFVNFDQSRWYPAPNYVVMKLWRDNFAPSLLASESESPELNGNAPIVNAVASKSEDGKTIFVKTVNNLDKDVELSVDLNIDLTSAAISATCVSPELKSGESPKAKLAQRNTLEDPNRIAPKEIAAQIKDGKVVVALPSFSASVVKIELK